MSFLDDTTCPVSEKFYYGTITLRQDATLSKNDWTCSSLNSSLFYTSIITSITAIFSLVSLCFTVDAYLKSDKDKKDNWSVILPATLASLSLITLIILIARSCFCNPKRVV